MHPQIQILEDQLLDFYPLPIRVQLYPRLMARACIWTCPLTDAHMDIHNADGLLTITGRAYRDLIGDWVAVNEWRLFSGLVS